MAMGVGILIVIATAAVVFAYVQTARDTGLASAASAAATGIAQFESNPQGTVTIDGVSRGVTPLTVTLPVGDHEVEIAVGELKRTLPLKIDAGTTVRQNIEFATEPVGATGRLEVTSEPSGAQVTIDGAPRGTTPLTVAAMAVGTHTLTISAANATIRRTVTISPGATSNIMASITGAGSTAGWVAIKAPIELNVLQEGQLIGTTNANRLMLPAGSHDLELVNPTFEFRTTMSVQVSAGQTASRIVAVPNGSLSVNALPWANVLVDGQDVGTTPLANLSLPLGNHEVVWRHPQFGERRRTVAITARTPTRVGVDFSQ
jgi:hypothetical protein